jgi:tryptophan synthase alpha chain
MTLTDHTTAIRNDGRKALVPFLTAGYPDESTFLDCARAAATAGADVIEIGVPFSDPIADGPVIQAASTTALAGGMTLARALALAASLSKEIATPLVIMSYVNPILSYGPDRFAMDANGAGVSGVILPDVSFEESAPLRSAFHTMDFIHLLAPTSSAERVEAIAKDATGFLYLVSLTGVTGARESLAEGLDDFVDRVRAKASVPLYVGFGVSTEEHARTVTASADGVIIGSRLIRLIDEGDRGGAPDRVGAFLDRVRRAIDDRADI